MTASTARPVLRPGSAPAASPYVLPEHLTTAATGRGPRLDDDVWDLRAFLPRSTGNARLYFTTIADPQLRTAVKYYLFSRLRRAIPLRRAGGSVRVLKVSSLYTEFLLLAAVIKTMTEHGIERFANLRQEDLDPLRRSWATSMGPEAVADRILVLQHLAAHGPHLPGDKLTSVPWPGRSPDQVAGVERGEENLTPRIPEEITAPYLRAAVFYVETASGDLLAARNEVEHLRTLPPPPRSLRRQTEERIGAFVAERRRQGRGIPALPLPVAHKRPDANIVDGVVQAPNLALIAQMARLPTNYRSTALLEAAAEELGYESGGLDTPMSPWPDAGLPWRPPLDALSLAAEMTYLRTACWTVIAYLSGLRDVEVRELSRDCAFTATAEDGRSRYKLRGKVFKGRQLTGEEEEWVVLDIVHRAVEVLLQVNDDPTHLFGYRKGRTGPYILVTDMPERLNAFQQHLNELFSTDDGPYIPLDGDQPWNFDTRQLRRTLAWHIAHQPFGIVAGAKQYKRSKFIMFEGYAGTSTSGFAAEVAAEEAVALLDHLEDLYRDWTKGARSSGGAAAMVDAEFDRIRAELGDLPGMVSDQARLRTMLRHLTKTLHPGVLNDCFFHAPSAVCVKRTKTTGRPLPVLNMCMRCPNARRSAVHLPRLTAARDAVRDTQKMLHGTRPDRGPAAPPHQEQVVAGFIVSLDQLIAGLQDTTDTLERPS
ncbi:hypothetical protein ACWDBD_32490 [Streptomyces sp. NPDC001118]